MLTYSYNLPLRARIPSQIMTNPNQRPKAGRRTAGQAQRASIEQAMDLKFPNFELLVTAMSANISTAGMFILSAEPAPVGTTLSFRFRIEDWSPIQGTARVIWNRKHDEASDRRAGMGVKFVELDAQSRRMIRYLVDKHLEAGGKPFELGHPSDSAADLEIGEAAISADSPVLEPQSNRLLWAVGAVLMVGAIGLGLWYQLTHPPAPIVKPPARMLAGGKTGVSSPGQVSSASDSAEASDAPGARLAEEAIQSLVQDWSTAWEGRQPEALFAFYAADFKPTGRETREQWEVRVRREMSAASFIRVAISALEVSASSATEGQATFFQSIRSDRRDETVKTTMELVRLNDEWKIIRQTIRR